MRIIEYDCGKQSVRCAAVSGEDGKWRGHVRVMSASKGPPDVFCGETPGVYASEREAVLAAGEWARGIYPPSA